jgi:hypothetical protein
MTDNNVALLDRLQYRYELRNTDKARMTSLSWAAAEGRLKVFEWLLIDYGHDDQELSRVSSRLKRCEEGEWETANQQDNENNSILHILAALPSPTSSFARHPILPPIIEHRSTEEIQHIALKMASDYIFLFPFLNNWCNSAGKTPLHIAAQLGNIPLANFLLDHGSDPDIQDAQGNSPLHYASAYGHLEILKTLLEAGCIHNGRNKDQYSASEFAFTERVRVELESTARAVSEGRRRQKREIRQEQSAESAQRERLRSGSVSTYGSGIASNTGSGSNQGNANASASASNNNYRQWALSSGSPNLQDRTQYFDAQSSRGDSPAPSRRGSDVSHVSRNVPPVPPLPPPKPQPHRSPSLPAPTEFRPLVIPPTPDQSSNLGSAAMRRANSAQVGLGVGRRAGSGSSEGQPGPGTR